MWLLFLVVAAAIAIPAALWGVSALWVRIISQRWDAMCADEEPPRKP